MSAAIFIVFFIFSITRVFTLFISIKNEKRLKQKGAQEYGKANSIILTSLHVLFYVCAFADGYLKRVQFDQVTLSGVIIYILSIVVLFCVIQQLPQLWTVKLIIANNHTLNKSFLFRYFRHPNYFLNIIPELIGITLIMKSYTVFMLFSPVYLVPLIIRIIQEEYLMRSKFSDY